MDRPYLLKPGPKLATSNNNILFNKKRKNVPTATSTETQKILGSFVASYGPRKRRWREAWIWPMPGFILSFVLIITGLDWYYYGYTQYGPVAAQSWSQNWLGWGLFIGVITLSLTTWLVLRARVKVDIHQYGIEVILPPHSSRSIRWEEINGITSAIIQDTLWGHTFRTRHQITIELILGNVITLDDRFKNLLELTTRLKANLYPRLLPGLRTRFQSGQSLKFGPISIHLNHISVREKQISWENIDRITVLSGHLIINMHKQASVHPKKIREPVNKIPNLELLMQILQRGINEQL